VPGETSRLINRSSERMIATGRAFWRDPNFEPYRRPALAFLISFVLAVLWQAALPDWDNFRGFGALLMGPIPATFGMAFGLYLHRQSPRWLLLLGAGAWAFLVEIASLVVLGAFVLGLWPVLRGVYATISVALFQPFGSFAYLSDPNLGLVAVWSVMKNALTWVTLVYAGVMIWRYDGLGLVVPFLSRYGVNRAFAREQRRIRQTWQREYMESVRAGVPPPPPPPELTVAGGARPLGHHFQTLFWVVRIGFLIVGGLSFWALFSDQLKGIVSQIAYGVFVRGLFGG
jgi:hypothetical protein